MVQLLSGQGASFTHKDSILDYPGITLEQIIYLMQNPQQVDKSLAWWFIPSDYRGPDARYNERQKESGRAHALVVDVDKGNLALEELLRACAGIVGSFQTLVYSSRGSAAHNRKWRVIFPLAKPIPGADYSYYERALRLGLSQVGVACDPSLDNLNQLVYLPNRGDYYEYHLQDGPRLVFEFQDGMHPLKRWALEYKDDDAQVQGQPSLEGSRSPLGAFRRKHSIESLLLAYDCSPSPHNPDLWRYNNQTSQHYGAIRLMRYFDGDRWVSRSDTFNQLGAGRATTNGSRSGDAFDLYVAFSCGHNWELAFKYAEQCLAAEEDQRFGCATAEHGRWLYENAVRIGSSLGPAGHREVMIASAKTAESLKQPEPEIRDKQYDWDIEWPVGVVGEMAKYLYRSSSRPVKQFAIAKALYIMAAMVGQRYNVEGFGLNLYMMIIGNSGTGKGEARRGTKRIYGAFGALAEDNQGVAECYDNNYPASESGLRKMFETRGSRAIYREDADALLESLTATQPGSNGDKLRGALSEFYDQSGEGLNMGAVRYAKSEDSTGVVQSPALTLGLDLQVDPFKRFLGHGIVLSTGIAARFIYVPRYGKRTHAQRDVDNSLPEPMLEHLKIIWNGLRMQASGVTKVQWGPEAKETFYKMDYDITERIRNGKPEEDLLNRAHMNAARVGACLAVGVNQVAPVLTKEIFAWAARFVMMGYEECLRILVQGEAGSGERVRVAKALSAIKDYVSMHPQRRRSYKVPKALDGLDDIICERYFLERLKHLADFKGSDLGATTEQLIRRTLEELVRQGYLVSADAATVAEQKKVSIPLSLRVPLYMLGEAWYE